MWQVGEKDQIFGSVTAAEVTEAIELQTGRALDKKVGCVTTQICAAPMTPARVRSAVLKRLPYHAPPRATMVSYRADPTMCAAFKLKRSAPVGCDWN